MVVTTNIPMPESWRRVLWYMLICTDVSVELATCIVKCRWYTLIKEARGSFERSGYFHFIWQDSFLFKNFLKFCSYFIQRFTFHYQLMHLLIKTLSQFTCKTTHVKNVCDAYLRVLMQYTSRHHTDRYIASINIQTTYRHKLECDEAGRLTRSNCVRYGNWPLLMVGGLTETRWVFKINFKYASQTFLTCVVLNVNCESVLINKCMSW